MTEFAYGQYAVRYLDGCDLVTSKFAVVKNVTEGVTKYRLILDCRVSGANDAACRHERILLPEAWDVVRYIMALRRQCCQGEQVYLFVLEFRCAFYMLPLCSYGRRYATAYDGTSGSEWPRGR